MPYTTRRNLCANPSMETNATGWAQWTGTGGTSTITRNTDQGAFGAAYERQNWTVAPTTGGGLFIYQGSDTGPDLVGKIFTGSLYIRPSIALTFYINVQYFKNGTPTAAPSSGPVSCPANVWTRVSWTPSVPPSAGDNKVSWRWYIHANSNGLVVPGTNVDYDACLVEESSSLNEFFDGRSAKDGYRYSWTGAVDNSEATEEKISDSVLRRNTVRNPKVRANLTDWLVNNGTGGVSTATRMTDGNLTIPETGQLITTYHRITWTTAPTGLGTTGPYIGPGSVDAINIVGGKNTTFSLYQRTSHADRTMQFYVSFHDSNGVQIGSTQSGPAFAVGASGTNWTKLSYITTPPLGATRAFLRVYPLGGTDWAVNDTIDTTAFLCEQTDTLKPYFDGDTPTTQVNETYYWAIPTSPNASQAVHETAGTPATQRRNLLPNPSFETNATGWLGGNGSTITRIAGDSGIGSYVLQITPIAGPYTGAYTSNGTNGYLVVAGATYFARALVKSSVSRAIRLDVFWYNSTGAAASVASVSIASGNSKTSSWTELVGSAVAPADAVYGAVYVRINETVPANELHFVDGVIVEKADSFQGYFDGDSPNCTWFNVAHASPSLYSVGGVSALQRRNKATNPAAEAVSVNWNSNNAASWTMTIDNTVSRSGSQSYKSTPQAPIIGANTQLASTYNLGGSIFLVTPGKLYSASVWIRHNLPTSVLGDCRIYFLDAASAVVGGPYLSPQLNMPNANEWYRVSMNAVAPLNAVSIRIMSFVYKAGGTGNVLANEFVWLDDCLIEESSSLKDYFDGSTPSKNGRSYQWTGAMDGSESIEIVTEPETRRNLAPNPSVQGTAFWSSNPASGTATNTNPDVTGPVGNKSFKMQWTVAATADIGGVYTGNSAVRMINIREGTVLTASAYVRANRSQRMVLMIYPYDAANVNKGAFGGAQPVINPNEWTRLSSTYKMPATTDHILIALYSITGTGFSRWGIGDTLEAQGVLIENSDTVNPYFDGDYSPGGLTSTAWTGTKYASESVLLAGSSNASRGDNIFAGLVAAGYYKPPASSSLADMERLRLLAKLGLSEPVKLSMADLYFLAGEKPRLVAFRR